MGALTVRRTVVTVVAIFVVATMAVTAYAVALVAHRDRKLHELQEHIEPARELATTVTAAMVDQETGLRGYVITGSEEFLEPYRRGSARGGAALRELHKRAQDDPTLAALVEEVQWTVDIWRQQAAEPEIEAVRSGRRDAAALLVSTRTGQARFDEVRAAVGRLRAELRRRQSTTAAELTTARARVTRSLVGMGALALLLISMVWAVLTRRVAEPLERMTADVDAVAAGDLQRQVRAWGPVDLVHLAGAVDAMRQRLVGELERSTRTIQALHQQAPAVDIVRAALAPTSPGGVHLGGRVRVAGEWLAAQGMLAGDFYEVAEVDDDGRARLLVAVVDVSGHGAGAGRMALQVRHLLAAALQDARGPAAALAWTAARLGDTGERFFTAFVAAIETDGTVTYVNAGHGGAAVVHPSGRVRQLGDTGPLVGPFPAAWEECVVQLEPGAVLVAYTDGVTEARDARGEQFGAEGTEATLAGSAGRPPQEVVAALVDAARRHSGETFPDDVTVVAVTLADDDTVAVGSGTAAPPTPVSPTPVPPPARG